MESGYPLKQPFVGNDPNINYLGRKHMIKQKSEQDNKLFITLSQYKLKLRCNTTQKVWEG